MQPINQPSVRNYNNVGTRNNGFEYRIMPLSFNLQQKGNDNLHNIIRTKYNINDNVSGICLYDNREHYGLILNIIYDEKSNIPTIAYILDMENKFILPLKYNTLKKYED